MGAFMSRKTEAQYQQELKEYEEYCKQYEREWGYLPRTQKPLTPTEHEAKLNIRSTPTNRIESIFRDLQDIATVIKNGKF